MNWLGMLEGQADAEVQIVAAGVWAGRERLVVAGQGGKGGGWGVPRLGPGIGG